MPGKCLRKVLIWGTMGDLRTCRVRELQLGSRWKLAILSGQYSEVPQEIGIGDCLCHHPTTKVGRGEEGGPRRPQDALEHVRTHAHLAGETSNAGNLAVPLRRGAHGFDQFPFLGSLVFSRTGHVALLFPGSIGRALAAP
jgi:hypothetical protein